MSRPDMKRMKVPRPELPRQRARSIPVVMRGHEEALLSLQSPRKHTISYHLVWLPLAIPLATLVTVVVLLLS